MSEVMKLAADEDFVGTWIERVFLIFPVFEVFASLLSAFTFVWPEINVEFVVLAGNLSFDGYLLMLILTFDDDCRVILYLGSKFWKLKKYYNLNLSMFNQIIHLTFFI